MVDRRTGKCGQRSAAPIAIIPVNEHLYNKPNQRDAASSSPQRVRFSSSCWQGAAALIVLILFASTSPSVRAENGGWDYQPYHVHAILAVDAPGGVDAALRVALPTYVQQRVDSSLAPLWNFELELAAGPRQAQVFEWFNSPPKGKDLAIKDGQDKLLLVGVRSTADGFEVLAREYDMYLQRWSQTLRRDCRQLSNLPEQTFAAMSQAFAPIAQIDVDPKDPQMVTLKPRGGSLPRSADTPPWAKPGDVLAPMFRRTGRNGQLLENGVVPVPWTYIETVPGKDACIQYRVRSGNRNPLAGRRSGRVEAIAILVTADPEPTKLVLRARKNDKTPLAGYDVYQQNSNDDPLVRVGTSNAAGEVQVQPGKARLDMLVIKHGTQLLAKLPVAPGAEPEITIPLPDDQARLVAEARLAAVREDLIDVVARRKILMSRARQKIEKKDFKAAEELARALDDLPGTPQFNLTLTTSARLIHSDDPQIQRSIDRLFQATQNLTTKFLDVRPINDLRNELRAAQQKTAAAPKSS